MKTTVELMSHIPLQYLINLELNDGTLPGSLRHDPSRARRFRGEGEFDIYRWYRAHPPTFRFYLSAMLWRSARWLYVGIFGIAVLIVISRASIFGSLTYIILGLLFGFVIRDLLYYRQTTLVWPVFNEIIDWSKVDALLQPTSDSAAQQNDM